MDESLAPAEEAFYAFLDRVEQGEDLTLTAFLQDTPEELHDEVRRLAAEHAAVAGKLAPASASDSGFLVEAGSAVGDYTLVRKLGHGGMGEVWEAQQGSLLRRVALKLLLPGRVNRRGIDYFAREARAGGRLSHPGIVAIHDTGESAGLHWIAMELIEGGLDLSESLDRFRQLPELPTGYYRRTAAFLADVADALEAAHQANVIHRDLKPANILITTDERAKVTDFGLAKLTDERSISMAGQLIGTYYYMSPEQVATRRIGIDHRTDIFSLGVVMYEMLTLVRPFEGDTTEQIARKIMLVDPPSPTEVRSRVPRDLSVICGKALEKDPDRRYPSMAELAADLRRHLADEPIVARPPGALTRASKWIRRHPTRSAVSAVAAVALLTISWLLLSLAQKNTALETEQANTKAALASVEDEQANTKAALARVEQEQANTEAALAEAQAARDDAEQRADELQQVSDFQARQLQDVDADAMGLAIRSMVLERARAAGLRAGRAPEVLDAEQAELQRILAGSDFTGIAVDVLDEQIFEGALQELDNFANQSLVQARLLQVVADTLRQLGRYDRADAPQQQALAIRQRELGDEHADTLVSLHNLGGLLRIQGRYDEAEPLLREALEGFRRVLGDEHPGTLGSIADLGLLFDSQGNYDEAEPLLREVLETRRRALGSEHPHTLASMPPLGLLLQRQARNAEAEALLREALEGQRRVLGDQHPDTLVSINNLGALLASQGRYEEAEPLRREALLAFRRVLGNEHPSTLGSIGGLGGLLMLQGKYDEAEPLLREALEARRRVLGDQHPSTLTSISNLGGMLLNQVRYEEAEPLLREALEGRRDLLGDNHPSTLTPINNMGLLLQIQGKYDEAEPLLREALEGARRVLGEEHPNTLASIYNLGRLLQEQGKYEEAEPLLREALEETRRVLGDDHPNTQRVRQVLESLLAKRKAKQTPQPKDGGGR